jgi:hypothetical protein
MGARSALGQRTLEAVKDLGGMDGDREGSEPPPEFLSDHRKSSKKEAKEKTRTPRGDDGPGPRPRGGPFDEPPPRDGSRFAKLRSLAMRQLGAKAETTPTHKKKHLDVARAYSQNQSLEAEETGQQIDRYV